MEKAMNYPTEAGGIDYIRIDSDILMRPDLNSTEKLIVGLVKSFPGRGLMLSNKDIGKLTGIRPDSVSKIVSRLHAQNCLHIDGPRSRYRRIYFGKNTDIQPCQPGDKVQSNADFALENNQTTRGFSQTTLASSLTALEYSPNKTKGTKRTERTQHTWCDDRRFASFWEAYPRKVGRMQALKAFRKLSPDAALLEVILAALEQQTQTEQWLRDDGRFIPHAATWLNGRRWEDEITGAECPQIRDVTEEQADDILRKAGLLQ